jgi:hypothetical protein
MFVFLYLITFEGLAISDNRCYVFFCKKKCRSEAEAQYDVGALNHLRNLKLDVATKPIPTIRIVILAGNGNTSNTINTAAVIASITPTENWIIDLFSLIYSKLEMTL